MGSSHAPTSENSSPFMECVGVGGVGGGGLRKLQALVYDIVPSTTAVFSYDIGSRKLSANEQFFVVVVKQY